MGQLLASTKDQAKSLYAQKVINQQTYNSIRINWLRAQSGYIKASDVLEKIIDTDSADITSYTELITQVSTILSDIGLWLDEPPAQNPQQTEGGSTNEPGVDRTVNYPAPATHHEPGSGDSEVAGAERAGQGSVEKVGQGYEGKSGVSDLGKLKVVSVSEATYGASDSIRIYGITEMVKEVLVWVSVGSIVYTLDGSEPVLTDGVSSLAISQCLTLDAAQATRFRAKASMSGTRLHVMILVSL
ncbi:hypothetical protein BIY37_04700 [Candidatus Brocadia sapporoensis]|uniref:Uncharacterized protein n=1 Tax=Candidatus Brocadia sapporoensis TaxID=392547 RepID=A0A1V6M149_9BACT|nr:hypothetical protein [Candidatus Brocadia sapporoensis]OQD46123.1 hypothetical protein BIY37_04700 [Candidatus Brocadia sapporoensis]GJQ23590.1 MAG: hypothetical protein HBSAPP01_13800 [Candidatus Brocadia sapporoensis]